MIDQRPALPRDATDVVPAPPSPIARGEAGPILRLAVRGKFLYLGDDKRYVRGVTYGTFGPGPDGEEYQREQVERDFAMMSRYGINAVRLYTVPPRWVLDIAGWNGLHVLVGLPWEQHVAFLERRSTANSIIERVREMVRPCAGHPALLGFAVGNEIPAGIVRWHGPRRVEAFLRRMAAAVRLEDPGALVTYVNYPSTEYLNLDFVDFIAFNVYLESPDRLRAYLARLQNLAGCRPLLMAEIGLDSRRNGVDAQAQTLDWQVRSIFESGCAGAFVFSWTDEWHRGGHDIEDWDFGLVDRDRLSKPALDVVRQAFQAVPMKASADWPRVSVVVCSYNGSRTIADCLDGIRELDPPPWEVIVVDDGSTDNVADVARGYDVHLIRTENQGLGAARNTGMWAATGDIVAHIDDDARPDPQWLGHLCEMYRTSDFVAIGGPNIAPNGDGLIAQAVAHAPGGPVHVLVSDTEADHVPGCNLTVRKAALESIGGFDPRYRTAGDDVDVCWRLQVNGGRLGFHPGAVVWHHRRNSVKAYWRQQQGYGKAEALLEAKWPERYNALGHLSWTGRLYGNGVPRPISPRRGRIYQGIWGSAPFQSLYQPEPSLVASLPLMPEWWLFVLSLAALSMLGLVWAPLAWLWPIVVVAALAPIGQSVRSAAVEPVTDAGMSRATMLRLRALIALLHVIQPFARLRGRIRWGLTPWRRRDSHGWRLPIPATTCVWSETWHPSEAWLGNLTSTLSASGVVVANGGDFDRWDLHIRGGALGSARVLLAIEEHGAGRQLARFRIVPRLSKIARALVTVTLALSLLAMLDRSWIAAAVLVLATVVVCGRFVREAEGATGAITGALREAP